MRALSDLTRHISIARNQTAPLFAFCPDINKTRTKLPGLQRQQLASRKRGLLRIRKSRLFGSERERAAGIESRLEGKVQHTVSRSTIKAADQRAHSNRRTGGYPGRAQSRETTKASRRWRQVSRKNARPPFDGQKTRRKAAVNTIQDTDTWSIYSLRCLRILADPKEAPRKQVPPSERTGNPVKQATSSCNISIYSSTNGRGIPRYRLGFGHRPFARG